MVRTEPNQKNSQKGTRENQHLFGHADITKIRKTCALSHVVIYLARTHVTPCIVCKKARVI